MGNQQAQALKVIQQIKDEWSENWDMVIDFLGQDIADKLDKIQSKASETTKGQPICDVCKRNYATTIKGTCKNCFDYV